MVSADGLLAPEKPDELKNIVKREVRVGLFDQVKKDLIFNCAHVVAHPSNKKETDWNFKTAAAADLNPLVFRTT